MLAIVRIIAEFPPIGSNRFDYRAYVDGEEERNRCGWGATEREAVEDLIGLESEES